MSNAFSINKSDSNLARVISENKAAYILGFSDGSNMKLNKRHTKEQFYVGDFLKVNIQNHSVLETSLIARKNVICKAKNNTLKDYHIIEADQIIATNIDHIFVMIPLDKTFSIAKVERYILVFSQENVELTIILSKKDLDSNNEQTLAKLTNLYPNIRFIPISIFDNDSIDGLKKLLKEDQTGLFIGSSGAGKSSIINLLQKHYIAKTNSVRNDNKGKHTTTSSLIIYCPDIRYNIVDTPGFKGIDSNYEIDMNILFERIDQLAAYCKFSNCSHRSEPGCAVKRAVDENLLEPEVLERYHYNIDKLELLSKRRKSWRL